MNKTLISEISKPGDIICIILKDMTHINILKHFFGHLIQLKGSHLVLMLDHHEFYLPVTDIISFFSIEVTYTSKKDAFSDFHDEMIERFATYVFNHNYKIIHYMNDGAFDYPVKNPFEFHVTKFVTRTRIYADWDYLGRISGGIDSIGGGIAFLSGSIGWSTSLERSFDNLIDNSKTIVYESSVADKMEKGLLCGYVYLFAWQFVSKRRKRQYHYDLTAEASLLIEGCKWIPAVICNEECDNPKKLNDCYWEYIYLKEDGFLIPYSLWQTINQKITLYVERIPVTMSTDFGKKEYIYIARCAAYVN